METVLKPVFILFFVIVPGYFFMAFLERKLTADFQARVGPRRVGGGGILQPFADLLKSAQKLPQTPRWNREALFGTFWKGIHTLALFATLALLPLTPALLWADSDLSAFFPFLVSLVLALAMLFQGMTEPAPEGGFGGLRLAVQALSGALPALLAILCAGIEAGGFRWNLYSETQGASPLQWIAIRNPFEFVAFFIFMASGHLLLGFSPLDSSAESPDIQGGVASLYTGRSGILFRLEKFYGLFLWTLMAVVLFLGAERAPLFLRDFFQHHDSPLLLQTVELGIVLLKTFFLMLILIWIGRSTPRLRTDQLSDLAWKVLGPLAVVALAGALLWAEGGTLL